MGLAVLDDQVLDLFAFAHVEVVFVYEFVVPTAVPDREPVGVSLPGVCKLGARQVLNVNISISVRVSAKVDLSSRVGRAPIARPIAASIKILRISRFLYRVRLLKFSHSLKTV